VQSWVALYKVSTDLIMRGRLSNHVTRPTPTT
jgi:hypothetical protein